MILTLYSATLTSILTVNRSSFSVKSIEDLLNHQEFTYGIEPGNAVQDLFEFSKYPPFQIMWSEMTKNKENAFLSEKEAVDKIRDDKNFAFIGESPFLEYDVTLAPCNLELLVSRNSPKTGSGYAFAFPKDSELVKNFSVETLKIHTDGLLSSIHTKWFKTRSQCTQNKLAKNVETIDFDKIRGIFFTFLGGIILPIVPFTAMRVRTKFKSYVTSKKNITGLGQVAPVSGKQLNACLKPDTINNEDPKNGKELFQLK